MVAAGGTGVPDACGRGRHVRSNRIRAFRRAAADGARHSRAEPATGCGPRGNRRRDAASCAHRNARSAGSITDPNPRAHASAVAHPNARTDSHGHAVTDSGDANRHPDGNPFDPDPRAFACTGNARGHAVAHSNRTCRHTDGDARGSDGHPVIRANGNRPQPAAGSRHA